MTPPAPAPGAPCLVTGAGGFVGVNLCRVLAGSGASSPGAAAPEVHGTVRPGGRSWRLAALESAARVHPVDLRDASAVRRLVREVRPRFVFHAAAHPAYRDGTLAERVLDDVLALAHLVDALAEAPLERLVVVGSSLAYGPGEAAHREDDPLRPASLRGALRAATSVLALGAARAGGLPVVELRVFSVYGPWEPLHRLVPRAIRAALAGEELALTAPDVHRGPRRDLVFVDDVAEACLRAATAPGVCGRAINVGTGREVANDEVVRAVERAVGRAIVTRPGAYPRHGTDAEHWRADVSRAAELLGWRPRHSLAEGLAVTVDWLREGLRAGGEAWLREGERR